MTNDVDDVDDDVDDDVGDDDDNHWCGPVVKISEALEHTLVAICSEPITNLGLEETIMMIMVVVMVKNMVGILMVLMVMMKNKVTITMILKPCEKLFPRMPTQLFPEI